MSTGIKRIYNVSLKRCQSSRLTYKVFQTQPTDLPSMVDLRSKCPEVFDQGELGSCTANALCSCYQYEDEEDDTISFTPSRLFVYYNERKMEHSISEDAGALISDGVITLQKYGVCPESEWPYDISKFTKKPPSTCYKSALKHRALNVTNIRQDIVTMKTSLFESNLS